MRGLIRPPPWGSMCVGGKEETHYSVMYTDNAPVLDPIGTDKLQGYSCLSRVNGTREDVSLT
jgi:hypothetical protein